MAYKKYLMLIFTTVLLPSLLYGYSPPDPFWETENTEGIGIFILLFYGVLYMLSDEDTGFRAVLLIVGVFLGLMLVGWLLSALFNSSDLFESEAARWTVVIIPLLLVSIYLYWKNGFD